jgi:hypothetical protein
MASLIFNEGIYQNAIGGVDFDTDTFKVLLTTSAYTENKDTQLDRADVTNEITGTGYTAGGNTVTVTVTKDTTNDRIDLSLGGTTWPSSTLTARKAVYYKSTGNAANDILIAVVDFGSDVVTATGTLTLTASTMRQQN